MKINKQKLSNNIEEIIANGVAYTEEIDITTKKVMDSIDELIVCVEQLNVSDGWMPIETAPKDGSEIVAYNSDGYIRKIKYTTYHPESMGYKNGLRDFWWEYISDNNYIHKFKNPIGWLPTPPQLKQK